MVEAAPALREKLAGDPHRPQYHFLPPAHWMNDPNGLIQWKGQYHLFYQHNPYSTGWGAMHWGHAASGDLVHWTDLPIALAPTPGGPDQDGCWSGCAVDNDGIPTLIYTGVHPQRPCLATSKDGLLTWEKYAGNPIITEPPEGLDVVGFRDHSVWREGDTWYQVIGSGIQGVGGAILLYRSLDLIHWEYIAPLLAGSKDQIACAPRGPQSARFTAPLSTRVSTTGTMWECPGFFPLDDKYVLLLSAHEGQPLYAVYFVGAYADHQFMPQVLSKLDFGDIHFYAPQTLADDQGRRVMWGWVQEGRSYEALQAAGWAGVMSLPRIVSMRPDGFLGFEPAEELVSLRGSHFGSTDIVLTPTSSAALDVRGDCLEIIAEVEFDRAGDAGTAQEFGLAVRCSSDGAEQTHIVYDRAAQRLTVEREQSSLSPDVHRSVHTGPLELSPNGHLRLHVFLDRSVLEVYANGRACITSRIYPSRPDSLGVGLFARGGNTMLQSLDVWEMGSIWAARSG
jgi:beta-fructofuranosidase